MQALREWAKLNHDVGTSAGRAAPVVLLAGLYLAFAGDWWGSGWLEALRHDHRMTAAEAYLLPGDLAIVFLMTAKPGVTGAVVTLGVAALAAVVLLRLPHGSRSEPAELTAT